MDGRNGELKPSETAMIGASEAAPTPVKTIAAELHGARRARREARLEHDAAGGFVFLFEHTEDAPPQGLVERPRGVVAGDLKIGFGQRHFDVQGCYEPYAFRQIAASPDRGCTVRSSRPLAASEPIITTHHHPRIFHQTSPTEAQIRIFDTEA